MPRLVGWAILLISPLLVFISTGFGQIGTEALSTPRPTKPKNNFLDSDSESLANLLSSPERFAKAMNMTLEEVAQTKQKHEKAREQLNRELNSPSISGTQKHMRICQHRLTNGRTPFVCPRCWSYLPVCVCALAPAKKIALPQNLSLVVWTHHKEWGLTSNTGGLLGLLIDDCHVLMKGFPTHESQFSTMIDDPTILVVVLWPRPNGQEEERVGNDKDTGYMPMEQVRLALQRTRVVLVAVDGTWRNARRMVARLPQKKVVYTDVPAEIVQKLLADGEGGNSNPGKAASMLAPLRRRGPNIAEQQVCTAEAVAGALKQLGLKDEDSDLLLSVARRKVDLICRYRAKVLPR